MFQRTAGVLHKLSLLVVFAGAAMAATLPYLPRYAVILEDPPAATYAAVSQGRPSLQVMAPHRESIKAAQAKLRTQIEARGLRITGTVQTVLNAIFVEATPQQAQALRSLPGVKGVAPVRRYRPLLNAAVQVVNGQAAWAALGGQNNAGLGMKIGILDTGIEPTHPAFQDSSLTVPAGYPKCDNAADCAFTNHKIIVARSYVPLLAEGFAPPDAPANAAPETYSRPDDYTVRDHIGHGTGVASIAAGNTNTGPSATITGIAPKAQIGVYKIFGSPGINDFSSGDIIVQALEDALNDGMNVVSLSLGAPALSGALASGDACGLPSGQSCDPEAAAAENAVKAGMVVVSAAGNEGADGENLTTATLSTIDSPGSAPSVISVGASENAHTWGFAVHLQGGDVPSGLQSIVSVYGNGPKPPSPLVAPLVDVAQLGNDGLLCTSIPANSMNGDIALVQRGTCDFSVKVQNAETAGAIGVIFIDNVNEPLDNIAPDVGNATIPSVIVGMSDGQSLKTFIDANPNHRVQIDTVPFAVASDPNSVTVFSSRGPSVGDALAKPDLVAPGDNIYMAAETNDNQGVMYSASGYIVEGGTSFSTPLTAGAAALAKQKFPNMTGTQVKSALVNNAAQVITDTSVPANVLSVGAGRLDAGAAMNAMVTSEPSSISFGVLNGITLPVQKSITLTNTGTSAVNLLLTVQGTALNASTTLALSPTSVSLAPGQATSITATLSGTTPSAGAYDGNIVVNGASTGMHIPFLYVVGNGIVNDIVGLVGDGDEGTVNAENEDPLLFKVIDKYGVPVANTAVTFRAGRTGGQIIGADSTTDANGIAGADVRLGGSAGTQTFYGDAGGLETSFTIFARLKPVIAQGGIGNAGLGATGPFAPGSYISIYGAALSDITDTNSNAAYLPVALDEVSVSFDVPSANLSVPGRISYVSSGQVNVLVPWELAGQSSADMKVRVGESVSSMTTIQIAPVSPAFFVNSGTVADAIDTSGALITAAHPAVRGQTISLYVNGLGAVSQTLESGFPSPSSPLVMTTTTPAVTIAGRPVPVSFSGLAPGYAGLYQVNISVPVGLPTGSQPITIAIGGVTSQQATIPIG